jgi:O-antigen/teichoic acid export membrane protein
VTSGITLTRNSIYAIVGQALPMIAAFVAIPFLMREMGDARFGVLTIAWAAVGYFAIFDFGLTRAVTHVVSVRLGREETEDLGDVAWNAMVAMFALGIVGALLVLAATPTLVSLLGVPEELRAECVRAFHLIALSVPWMVSTGGFRGLLEAHQHFGASTLLRIPLAVIAFAGPLLVLPYTVRLEPMMMVLVAGRIVMWALHLIVCLRRYAFLRHRVRIRWATVAPLLRFGGWTTVSNVVVPLMGQLDRFAVAVLVAIEAAAFYAPPFELAMKLLIIPAAVGAVLFPSLSTSFVRDRYRTTQLVDAGLRAITALLFPFTLVLVAFAPEILLVWLGSPEKAVAGAPVLILLAELPFYGLLLWAMGSRFGLAGVAMASVVRLSIEAAIFYSTAAAKVDGASAALARSAAQIAWLGLVLVIAAAPASLALRSVIAATALVGFAAYSWQYLIKSTERVVLARSLGLTLPG